MNFVWLRRFITASLIVKADNFIAPIFRDKIKAVIWLASAQPHSLWFIYFLRVHRLLDFFLLWWCSVMLTCPFEMRDRARTMNSVRPSEFTSELAELHRNRSSSFTAVQRQTSRSGPRYSLQVTVSSTLTKQLDPKPITNVYHFKDLCLMNFKISRFIVC